MIETILFWAAMWALSGLVVLVAGTLIESGEITVDDLQYVWMSVLLGPLMILLLLLFFVGTLVNGWWRVNRHRTIISFRRRK